jgi:hypothetical protein
VRIPIDRNSSPVVKTEKIWKIEKDHSTWQQVQSCCFCSRIEEERAVHDSSNAEMADEQEHELEHSN